jgi:hypothetical protein
MKALHKLDQELYGPRKKLEGKQLEEKMKAPRAARRSHEIMKWTALINDALISPQSDLNAQEMEREMNDGEPVIVSTYETVREKKRARLAKYMTDPKSLIAPYDPDDDYLLANEDLLPEADDVVRPTGGPDEV